MGNLGCADLSEVSAEVLSRAVNNLHKVNLKNTELKTEQCRTVLFNSIASVTLTDLTLRENDLSDVPSSLLVRAVGRLKKVDLENCWLTMEQCSAILTSIMTSNASIDLNIGGNELLDARFAHVTMPGFSVTV